MPAAQRITRRRLSAKLRPLMLRRLKQQVAKDLPDRIEERRDCELGEEQRKLYLAELRRSRDQVMQARPDKGLAQSQMHVLAALTRLRQICCHPALVGNDTASGKTETLFELLEPLLAEGAEGPGLFSNSSKCCNCSRRNAGTRSIVTHILTGHTKDRQEVVRTFQEETVPACFSCQPPRRRHRPQPDHRQLCGSLRSLVEPGRGGAGHRPLSSHRPDPHRQRLSPHQPGHCRGKDLGTAAEQRPRPSPTSSARRASPRTCPAPTSNTCSPRIEFSIASRLVPRRIPGTHPQPRCRLSHPGPGVCAGRAQLTTNGEQIIV